MTNDIEFKFLKIVVDRNAEDGKLSTVKKCERISIEYMVPTSNFYSTIRRSSYQSSMYLNSWSWGGINEESSTELLPEKYL